VPDDVFDKSDVKGWLESISLGDYYDKFIDNGWDDLAIIRQSFTSSDNKEILKETGVTKIGHVMKLIAMAAGIRLTTDHS
jgi:hypothetical protein